jgi:hypothetical protein
VDGHEVASPLEYAHLIVMYHLISIGDNQPPEPRMRFTIHRSMIVCLMGLKLRMKMFVFFYDAIISEMTIQVVGFTPDAPYEIVEMTGSVAGINVTGSGTDMITLSNSGGAKSTDFIDALHLVVYNNISGYPTGGLRTVEVQFTTESGHVK